VGQVSKAFKSTDKYKEDPTILKYTEEGNYDNITSNNSQSNNVSQIDEFQTNDSLSKNPEVKLNKVEAQFKGSNSMQKKNRGRQRHLMTPSVKDIERIFNKLKIDIQKIKDSNYKRPNLKTGIDVTD